MTIVAKYQAVVVGGSWGGMHAVIKMLSCLPPTINFSFIIVLHRLKDVKSPLVELIAAQIKIPVKEADEKEAILPGHAYIAPANYHLLIESDKTFSLDASERVNFSRPSIDVTFESAAQAFKDKLIGIVLTGANEDGSKGLQKIGEAGGCTIIQDPKDALSPTMPKAAIQLINTAKVLPLTEICSFLVELAKP